MNKAQLIDAVADRLGESKKMAGDAVDAVLDTITRNVVNGTKISITGFGSFEKVERPARVARNPRTGERVRVKKSSVPKFRAGQAFKDVVSGDKKLPRATAPAKRAAAPAKKAATTAKKTAPTKKAATTKATTKKAATRPAAKKATPATKVVAKKATPAKKTAVKATAKKTTPAKKTAKR